MSDLPPTLKLSQWDFFSIFEPLTPYVVQRIEGYKFEHRSLTNREIEQHFIECAKAVCEKALPQSGPARHPVWEAGWGENLNAFDPSKAGLEVAKPRYFDKYPVVRWGGGFYKAVSKDYEYNMLAVIQDYLFDKYLRDSNTVCEFGCGTGHNLFRVRDINPDATLVGLDWAKSAVEFIKRQAAAGAYSPGLAFAMEFDFFKPLPPYTHNVGKMSFVTVASLEQVGQNWQPWLDFVLAAKPSVVVHIEPIEEVLEPDAKLMDYLCVQYFKKRNYLSGYLTKLRELEQAGKIKLHEVKRTRIGSKFIEGYTVIVWSPL